MPLSRCLKNDMRAALKPKPGTKESTGSNTDAPGTTKRNQVTGPKYTGPNYPRKDTKVVGSGMK